MSHTIAAASVLWAMLHGLPPATCAPRADVQVVAASSYLGVGIIEVSKDAAKEIGLLDPHGVEISSVADKSPAQEAGLLAGDIVLTYRDERVNGIQHFARLVRETPAGNQVELGVVRDRARLSVDVEIGEREARDMVRSALESVKEGIALDGDHLDAAKKHLDAIRMSLMANRRNWCQDCPESLQDLEIELEMDLPSVHIRLGVERLGAELEKLEGQLASFFGVEAGVLVRAVSKGSPTDRAGLRAGDVIVSVAGKLVTKPSEIDKAVASVEGGGEVQVEIVRDRKPVSLGLELLDTKRPVPAGPVPQPN